MRSYDYRLMFPAAYSSDYSVIMTMFKTLSVRRLKVKQYTRWIIYITMPPLIVFLNPTTDSHANQFSLDWRVVAGFGYLTRLFMTRALWIVNRCQQL